MKCPHCEGAISVGASMPDDQRLTIGIDYEGDILAADAIWQTIKSMEKCLVETGRSLGSKTKVFIRTISQVPGKVSIEFFIVSAKN